MLKRLTGILTKQVIFIAAVSLCISSAVAGEIVPVIQAPVDTEFGTYVPVPVHVSPSVSPYDVADDFSNVSNIADFELSSGARELLETNAFASVASPFRQMYDIYNENRDEGIPAFVSTDVCLHSYHILYDYILRVVEHKYFINDLDDLTRMLILDMQQVCEEAADSSVKDAALDNIAYLSVALKLLDPEAGVDDRVADVVQQETAMIMELSSGYVPSPLMYSADYPYEEDYSQYKPRGHYTRSEEFEKYFRAMMWYGRMTFSLNLPYATQEGLRHAALQALLLSRSLDTVTTDTYTMQMKGSVTGTVAAKELWRRIYEPTVFFVGKADDVSFADYITTGANHFGRSFVRLSPDVLADNEKLDAFIDDAVKNLPDPKITVKAGKGFRMMGQRYIPDSYILDQMVDEFVRTRTLPRGLEVMNVLGSERAYGIVDERYRDNVSFPDYDPQLVKLKAEFAALPPAQWAENLYYNWLYTLVPLLREKGDGYPSFMTNQTWTDKSLSTALGSWAELRHDTILYAKQSETREFSSDIDPDLVMGYVEPEPEVYARLAALAAFTRTGLESRGLLDELFVTRLLDFEALMLSLSDIAARELENSTLTAKDAALMVNFGETIEKITVFPKEFGASYENEADDFMAVIADVHTDPNTNQALEVGVGHPLALYVVAPVNGVLTLTRGGMFSYHEFARPLSEGRLTDEEWQKLQSGADAIPMPDWTESFVAGPSSMKREALHFDSMTKLATSVEKDEADKTPGEITLFRSKPNPFNPSTTISYNLKSDAVVKLAVYSLNGQLVDTIVNEWQGAGSHSIVWMPENMASGMYVVRIHAGNHTGAIKVTFMK